MERRMESNIARNQAPSSLGRVMTLERNSEKGGGGPLGMLGKSPSDLLDRQRTGLKSPAFGRHANFDLTVSAIERNLRDFP